MKEKIYKLYILIFCGIIERAILVLVYNVCIVLIIKEPWVLNHEKIVILRRAEQLFLFQE